MSVRNGFVLLLALSTLMFLAACGGSSSTATPVAPPSGGFSNSNLNGTYVFSVSGSDFNGDPYAVLGTFTANGSGGITGGSIDMNDTEFTASVPDASVNSNSFYSINVDGRGQITLGVPADPFGGNDHVVLDFVLQDSSHGLVIEFDGNATGSGSIDLQSSGVTPAGTYAFLFAGGDTSGAFATAGNFTVASGGAVTGTQDFNSGGIAYPDLALTGTVVAGPSTTPASNLTVSSGGFGQLIFDVYPIDSTHLKFIEMDTTGTLLGDAFSQSSTATVPTGTLAFTMNGAVSGDSYFAAGGFIVTDGNGNITSSSSEDLNQDGSPSTASVPFTGSYAAAGTGRFLLNNFSSFVGGTQYAAYPYTSSSGGSGLFLLENDDAGTTVGAAYLQTSTANLVASQGYGLNLSGVNLDGSSPVEVDQIAEFSTGTSGNLTGIIDQNYAPDGAPTLGLGLSDGTYGNISTGRNGVSADAATLAGGFTLTLYTVDGTTFPFIESDNAGQVSTGVVIQQSASAVSPAVARTHAFVVPRIISPHPTAQSKSLKKQ